MIPVSKQKESRIKVDWRHPTEIRFGVGRINEISQVCWEHGICSPLLVTDKTLAGKKFIVNINQANAADSIETDVFAELSGEPDAEIVTRGAAIFRKGGYDGIIVVGGGSVLDAGKAIGLASVVGPMNLWKYTASTAQPVRSGRPVPRIIAVPTTAGTGSEINGNAVITDPSEMRKVSLYHPDLLPKVVIADPALTRDLIPYLTASTGMDALAHNIEALCSPVFQPMLDGIAVQALGFIKEWLPVATTQGRSLKARVYIMAASIMGAMAFEKGLGAMHAVAHAIGGKFKINHGRAVGTIMPYVLKMNRKPINNKMAYLARCLNLPHHDFNAVLNWVTELRYKLGIPNTLRSLGVKNRDISPLIDQALLDINLQTNPLKVDKSILKRMLRNAIRGSL